ncbi:MAG: 3-hydroxyacyl-ACP dehydratase FabZ family protein [Pirellulales bacterium]
MRYTLIDRIVEIEPGRRLTAVKVVSLSEDYLRDHFPRFPVLPGVFMLEAMTQASAWLVRSSEDFSHSIVVLKEAINVKYADFVPPGKMLTVTVELKNQDATTTTLVTTGLVEGNKTVSGRLVLERFNLADTRPEEASTDLYVKREMRTLFSMLTRECRMVASTESAESTSASATTAGNVMG